LPEDTRDFTTFANFLACRATHYSIDLTADFDAKELHGSVTVRAMVLKDGCRELELDTRHLAVSAVWLVSPTSSAGAAQQELALGYQLRAGVVPEFGMGLSITLPPGLTAGQEVSVKVCYRTDSTQDNGAVQWCDAAQTLGKVHPYMYTQCQAIHCRSMLPCQDAPGVKATYDARLVVPESLVALMSAVAVGAAETDGVPRGEPAGKGLLAYRFVQRVPMSSYLIAIAIGKLESKRIGPRTRVWGEAGVVEAAASEFRDTELFLSIAEDLCGPYVWGRYDLLCMPPSFPYGGMENPCLTFVTPTLLAGDRSLANVVAHEIAHSWMGNLVTNRACCRRPDVTAHFFALSPPPT
jgi:leukotriene-A4 hydrolase